MPRPGEPTATPDERHSPPCRVPAGWQRRELVIWGAHGGAGTTTLATWLQPAWDMGAMRPEPDPPYPADDRPRPRAGGGLPQHRLVRARRPPRPSPLSPGRAASVAVLAVVSDGWPEPAAATGPVPAAGSRRSAR